MEISDKNLTQARAALAYLARLAFEAVRKNDGKGNMLGDDQDVANNFQAALMVLDGEGDLVPAQACNADVQLCRAFVCAASNKPW